MHSRPLPDTFPPESYVVVSRGVNDPGSELKSGEVKGEILLGINVMEGIDGEDDACILTTMTHVTSALTPGIMAKSIGINGAVNFIKDIRKMERKY